jgi:mannose/fructose/N-acetylgalactosamine-specific phosphotransferase system component IID
MNGGVIGSVAMNGEVIGGVLWAVIWRVVVR